MIKNTKLIEISCKKNILKVEMQWVDILNENYYDVGMTTAKLNLDTDVIEKYAFGPDPSLPTSNTVNQSFIVTESIARFIQNQHKMHKHLGLEFKV